MNEPSIELIARGVLIHGGKLLVCRSRNQGHTFLPGGHIDFGEKAAVALEREIREELGIDLVASTFLGGCEAAFDQVTKSGKTRRHHEINLVFALTSATKSFDPATIRSQEDHIEFIWLPLAAATDSKSPLLPTGVGALISDATSEKGWLSVFA